MFKLNVDSSDPKTVEIPLVEEVLKSLDIPQFTVRQGEALHRQITKHIRSLIYSGDLPAGSKLPRMHDLAAHWKTNYFTVHTAMSGLVSEGLVERKPRMGTFVRKQGKELRSVGLYYGDEILMNHERGFYRSLHVQLLAMLHGENISTRIFMDCRPKKLRGTPLLDVANAIKDRKIQALIVPLIDPALQGWANHLPIPASLFSSARTECSRIYVDTARMMNLACRRLRDEGCRTVGLIHPAPPMAQVSGGSEDDNILVCFHAALKKFGLGCRNSWIRVPRTQPDLQEKYGYQEFHKLWSQRERPDGLIVYPENVAHGVVLALLEQQVKVPTELKLVLHKNQNVNFLCPVSANWIITRERDIAEALIQQIKDRFGGLQPHNYIIRNLFVKAGRVNPMAAFEAGAELEGRG
jgi:DNA-binding transcriptional regulator YhcF (GntR family)